MTGPGTDRGVVFQEYALFPWLTVAQNIRYGLEMTGLARRERARDGRAGSFARIGLARLRASAFRASSPAA